MIVLDKENFPRHKTCAGWITPLVLRTLELSLDDYRGEHIAQPITGFRTGLIGSASVVKTSYGETVSYGIRRCEFDDYLLKRSGADLRLGERLDSFERTAGVWTVNDSLQASLVIGAGGHFCPVARRLNPERESQSDVVQAQESEFPMTPEERASCRIAPEVPELYFCPDLRGYGWCFRKGDYLNIGLGRQGEHHLSDHVARFVAFLQQNRRIGFAPPTPFKGHAYRLHGSTHRRLVGDGLLLIGDAAGFAVPQSGEGIRPAIESGLIAADVILEAAGDFSENKLFDYQTRIDSRFGTADKKTLVDYLSQGVRAALARRLLGSKWFTRRVLLDRWFLQTKQPLLGESLARIEG